MSKLIKSNRNIKDLQPKHTVSMDDLNKKPVATSKPKAVTFDTNLKITNHSRNKLMALMTLGYTASQKEAVDLLFESFRDQLDADSRKELDFQIKTLERRDAKLKG